MIGYIQKLLKPIGATAFASILGVLKTQKYTHPELLLISKEANFDNASAFIFFSPSNVLNMEFIKLGHDCSHKLYALSHSLISSFEFFIDLRAH